MTNEEIILELETRLQRLYEKLIEMSVAWNKLNEAAQEVIERIENENNN